MLTFSFSVTPAGTASAINGRLSLIAVATSSKSSVPSRFLEAVPLILAAVYYLFAPFFSNIVRKALMGHFREIESDELRVDSKVDSKSVVKVPPHLKPEAIGATIDWVIDAPQMVPTLLLPLAAAVFAINNDNVSGVILAFAVIVITVAALWICSQPPLKYGARRFFGYTVVAALGIVLNMTAAVLLLVL